MSLFSVVLNLIHGGIRHGDHLFCVRSFVRGSGKVYLYGADAAEDRQPAAAAAYYKLAPGGLFDPQQTRIQITDIFLIFHYHQEFISANPTYGAAGFPGKQGGQKQQNLIAHMMSIIVIKYFKIVNVKEKYGNGCAVRTMLFQGFLEKLADSFPVQYLGKSILFGLLLQKPLCLCFVQIFCFNIINQIIDFHRQAAYFILASCRHPERIILGPADIFQGIGNAFYRMDNTSGSKGPDPDSKNRAKENHKKGHDIINTFP